MFKISVKFFSPAVALSFGALLLSSTGYSAELPKSTQDYLKKIGMSADFMNDLDKELEVPKSWTEAALKEGKLRVLGSWTPEEFDVIVAPFRSRFPAIKLTFTSASNYYQRAVAPLVAWKEKQPIADVLLGFGGSARHYKKEKALLNLKELPNIKNPVDGANDPKLDFAGVRLRFWCMAYNTNALKKSDMPKTWQDLLTNKKLQNGNIGAGNRPQLWMLMLRTAWGKESADKYIHEFFNTVKPQFRKEGMSALMGLVVAGEFNVSLPSAAYAVRGLEQKGAPIAWHCPEPVPIASSQVGIMTRTENTNAARVWVNWILSKEGQLASFVATYAPPSHRHMQRKEFLVYPDELVGKKLQPGDDELQADLFNTWKKYWRKAGK